MDRDSISLELKTILEQANMPSRLDNHPWTRSLTVLEFIAKTPSLGSHSPGYQLLAMLSALFQEMMPSTPPRQGKRLDSHWGQFGILGALYFAPFEFDMVRPATQLDAWGRIDDVISLFVFGEQEHGIPKEDVERYRLVGNETETAPISTISGWHTKGLERLAASFINRERLLSARLNELSIVLDLPKAEAVEYEGEDIPQESNPSPGTVGSRFRSLLTKYQRSIWLMLILALLIFLGWKSWRVFYLARAVQSDAQELQSLVTYSGELEPETIATVGALLGQARDDVVKLDKAARPFLWAGHLLGWVPVYGPDLKSAKPLLDLAIGVIFAADETYDGLLPLLEAWQDEDIFLSPPGILILVEKAQPQLEAAQLAVERAVNARAAIDADRLSPRTSRLLEKIDLYLPLLEGSVQAAVAAPNILGAQDYGPQTYLVLLQNEDELRATGGFITSVGVITIDSAEITSFSVEDSFAIDDPEKTSHTPPWQLHEYMRTGFWYIRDSNWSPNFPTAAEWAERMYVYHQSHAVDGVIAIDQETIRLLLEVIGSVEIEDSPEPITADNVIQFIRFSKSPAEGETLDEEWLQQRKDIIQPLGRALLDKLQDPALSWVYVANVAVEALDEHHILIQLDNPDAAAVLASRGWDGAIQPGEGDFLMVVDSNLGFNKVNAAVYQSLHYRVDLSNLEAPTGALTVTHTNPADSDVTCRHAAYYGSGEYADLINRCYWNYLRVYTLDETVLIGAALHEVPGEWMIREETILAQVDDLTNHYVMPEIIPGVRVFGTLLVVPGGKTLETRFDFNLPPSMISSNDDGFWTYTLRVQKQPGTKAIPLDITVKLPFDSQFVGANSGGVFDEHSWHFEGALRKDVEITLFFSMP